MEIIKEKKKIPKNNNVESESIGRLQALNSYSVMIFIVFYHIFLEKQVNLISRFGQCWKRGDCFTRLRFPASALLFLTLILGIFIAFILFYFIFFNLFDQNPTFYQPFPIGFDQIFHFPFSIFLIYLFIFLITQSNFVEFLNLDSTQHFIDILTQVLIAVSHSLIKLINQNSGVIIHSIQLGFDLQVKSCDTRISVHRLVIGFCGVSYLL